MSDSVYIIRSDAGPLKIGVSRDVEARAAQLSQCQPFEARVVFVQEVANAQIVERAAHQLLRERRLRGEWFDVSEAEAVAAVRRARKMVMVGEYPTRLTQMPGCSPVFTVRIPNELMARIIAWADIQPDRPKLGTAIKRLIRRGLAA